MRWLDQGQQAMMQALDHGPAHLPGGLFAGTPERVLAAMKVHANTISHARLVELEDTFPRPREAMGHDRFNALSRCFIEQPDVTAQPLTEIGAGFDRFLLAQGAAQAEADLARFEWLWLTAYHAADAEPVTLADLAGFDPETLMAQRLVRHPAAHAGVFSETVHQAIGAEVPELLGAEAILLARPFAEVLISPATGLMEKFLCAARNADTIGNLVTAVSEPLGADDDAAAAVMAALVALLNAGALAKG